MDQFDQRSKDRHVRQTYIGAEAGRRPPFRSLRPFPLPVIFGSKVTDAAPDSTQGLHLVVSNIELAH
ncbi:hypothetical protein RLEG3_03805 (plasmid) [Rhizobium leguminosarum bv. trifolii WSM1689]|nr:hypothetical protein RLEG3_03805 [Rhizobium leguminosarum bv. trifolii WSM1689]